MAENTSALAQAPEPPHFVLVPLMAQGHMIPMTDLARQLAHHGSAVSFVTTPLNAARLQPFIDDAASSGLAVSFLILPFPCAAAGLPDGCENLDVLPGSHLIKNFVDACVMLRDPLASRLRSLRRRPDCIVSDSSHHWTGEIARELHIPRLSFVGFCGFSSLCRLIIHKHGLFSDDDDDDDDRLVSFPEFPHRLEITKAQAPVNFGGKDRELDAVRAKARDEDSRADGVVLNSFYELEPMYLDAYTKVSGKKIWTVGPLLLGAGAAAFRGKKASVDEDDCRRWLDKMKDGSVIYVSFGSLATTPLRQLVEIGVGLEASGQPFVWVIKAGNGAPAVEQWLAGGFEERVKERGFVIRGWAPQLMILNHPAVGGFMTHCGWNSALESITAGVPMITWPHFAEQFLNEKLVVDVLGIGVKVGVEKKIAWRPAEGEAASVSRVDVEKAVAALMGDGEDADERRRRARECKLRARMAVEEGGSSYVNCKLLIQQARRSETI